MAIYTMETDRYNGSTDSRSLKFEWELTSQSTAKNTSTIAWTIRGGGTGSGYIKAQNIKLHWRKLTCLKSLIKSPKNAV